ETASYRGQDARVTRGRDARDTQGRSLGLLTEDARDTVATEKAPDPFFGRAEKQSQFATGGNELSPFEKREYELLLGAAPRPNEANDLCQKTEIRGLKTDDGGQKRKNLPFDNPRAGVCRY
ncbi:MAG: hypothetical protein JXM79_23980, partial [Sedimentisphaerales bacterium]|nr:hypothetical protein [Sedimentisphaerales bacterium]